jgi:hypothetical protein
MFKAFEMPKQQGLSPEDRQKGLEIYDNLKAERQEAANMLAELYEDADNLGIDLENEYDPKSETDPNRIKLRNELMAQRMEVWMWLESSENVMRDVEKSLGIAHPNDA